MAMATTNDVFKGRKMRQMTTPAYAYKKKNRKSHTHMGAGCTALCVCVCVYDNTCNAA